MRRSRRCFVLAAVLAGCGGTSAGPDAATDAATTPPPPDGVPVATPNPAAVTNPAAACRATVVVALYGNAACTPGTEMMLIPFNLAQDCFGWSRQSDRGTVHNSATRVQCYRDRICYTQHTETLACDAASATDKETRTDGCTLEPMGNLWTRILSGTESCPEAPAGFQCPTSAPRAGTAGVAAATACGP